MNTVRNAYELHGEDRNANAKHIYETLKQNWGDGKSKWTIFLCPI